jgi:hypothetical protein
VTGQLGNLSEMTQINLLVLDRRSGSESWPVWPVGFGTHLANREAWESLATSTTLRGSPLMSAMPSFWTCQKFSFMLAGTILHLKTSFALDLENALKKSMPDIKCVEKYHQMTASKDVDGHIRYHRLNTLRTLDGWIDGYGRTIDSEIPIGRAAMATDGKTGLSRGDARCYCISSSTVQYASGCTQSMGPMGSVSIRCH